MDPVHAEARVFALYLRAALSELARFQGRSLAPDEARRYNALLEFYYQEIHTRHRLFRRYFELHPQHQAAPQLAAMQQMAEQVIRQRSVWAEQKRTAYLWN